MTTVYKLKDYRQTIRFEREHPKPLQWDERYKTYLLSQKDGVQGIWIKEKDILIGEVILTWDSDNVAHVDSFTVLPEYRGKGIGYDLIKEAINWTTEYGMEYIVGEARQGASWNIFQKFGAEEILTHKNWTKTNESYVSFKIKL